MVAIARELAVDCLRKAGIIAVLLEPAARPASTTKIRLSDMDSRPIETAPGMRVWFKSRREAERVMADVLGQHRETSLAKGASCMRAAADIETAFQWFWTSAKRLGITASDDREVEITLTSMEGRISKALTLLRTDALMKKINREYRDIRDMSQMSNDVPSPGSYGKWVVNRLAIELGGVAGLALITRL